MPKDIRSIIAIIIIGLVVYLPSLFGSFIWDDEDFVYANKYVQTCDFGKLWSDQPLAGRSKFSNYYRPLQFSIYAGVWCLGGNNPLIFHLVLVLTHIGAAVSAYFFLRALSLLPFLALLSSVLFLIHPVQTESVSYISGLSDPLYVLFLFISLRLYILKNRGPLYIFTSLFFFLCALFSKEFAIVGIPIVFLYTLLFFPHQLKRQAPHLIVYSGIGCIYLLLRFTLFNFATTADIWGSSSIYAHTIWVRLGTFSQSFFTYLSLLIAPVHLYMERDLTITLVQNLTSPWPYLFVIFVYISVFIAAKNGKLALFLYCSFLLSFLPISGIIPLNGIFYEHYIYLALFFFWTYMCISGKKILPQYLFLPIFICIFALFCVRSFLRQYEWIDNERFYTQTLSYAPKSVRILNNLGMALAEKEQYEKALNTYKQASILDPSLPQPYHNSARIYLRLGNRKKAKELFEKALSVDPQFVFSRIELQNMQKQSY